MNLAEGLRIALWSLTANPLRSFLTLLGIIMGVTAIIAVVAVINGLNLYVQERMITLGPGCFEVNRYGIITNRQEWMRAMRRNRPLRLSDAEAVSNHATLASQVAVKVYGESDLRYENRVLRSVRLKGITHEIMLIEPYDVQSGRPLGEEDNARSAAVTFLGADIAEQLFGPID